MITTITLAAGRVTGTTGVLTGAGAVTARTGAGVYTVTLDQQVDQAQSTMNLTLEASGVGKIVHTSDSVKTVSTFAVDGTTATDKDFNFEIKQILGI
jgi:hypothetical protein